MLDHLSVQNYRLFKDLNIPKLAQINLVTGKNNAGKSTLLEVIRILESEGDSSVVNNILDKRGDWKEGDEEGTYAALFNNQNINKEISINGSLIRFNSPRPEFGNKRSLLFKKNFNDLSSIEMIQDPGGFVGVEINSKVGDRHYPQDKVIFIPPNIDFDNTHLWDKIELTPQEDEVKNILHIIIPDLIDLAIGNKGAKVRLKNAQSPASLKNFGEGTNRLLMIALALVSARDNTLIIDEIDLGLHYTIHEKLWEIIFQFAKKWNIQVFATTHSKDCLSAFSYLVNRGENHKMGMSLRLQKEKDNIGAVEYTPEELENALTFNIETR